MPERGGRGGGRTGLGPGAGRGRAANAIGHGAPITVPGALSEFYHQDEKASMTKPVEYRGLSTVSADDVASDIDAVSHTNTTTTSASASASASAGTPTPDTEGRPGEPSCLHKWASDNYFLLLMVAMIILALPYPYLGTAGAHVSASLCASHSISHSIFHYTDSPYHHLHRCYRWATANTLQRELWSEYNCIFHIRYNVENGGITQSIRGGEIECMYSIMGVRHSSHNFLWSLYPTSEIRNAKRIVRRVLYSWMFAHDY